MRHIPLVLVLIPVLVAGCGRKKPPDSAEGVAQAFAKCVTAGKTADAADLFDYVDGARRQNEDWDSIASGQRNLIVGKLKEEKASLLKSAFPAGSKVAVKAAGAAGTYAVSVNGAPKGSIRIQQTQAGWKIVGMQ
jgi:hypothetical protein